MPYQLQSALGAGLADAAGFMAGQTERKRYLAEQQMQANRDAQAQAEADARLGLERSNQEATNAYRTTQTRQGEERLKIERDNAARAQGVADAEAQKQKLLDTFKGEERDFFGHEMALSPDPVKRLGQLQKRYDIERGHGYDTKSTESQMNKAATEIEQAKRDAALAKQRDTQNANTAQRIQISVDRGGAADRRAASAAGDPQSFADVSGRLAHAKSRDDAQAILDSPEGSLLNDRQYTRLQKQVDETYGTHEQTHKPPPKPPKKTALDEVKEARSHGIKDDRLIINTLVGNGYTEAAAKAAVKAAP